MRKLLSGKWTFAYQSKSYVGYVPGDVTNDLYQAGIIKNPYYGENYKESLWVAQSDWEYVKEFVVEELPTQEEDAFIQFDGIDTFAEVYLNGIRIGETSNMHLTYRFTAESALKKGENTLVVKLLNVYDKIGKIDQTKYDSIFCANRVFARKAQCHFGWDWAPQFPGYGIYRDVYFVKEKKNAISDVSVIADVQGNACFRIENKGKYEGELIIRICFNGEEVAKESKVVSAKRVLCNLKVDNPRLWWPNGYGLPNLYTYTVERVEDGERKEGTFGFREIEIRKNPLDRDNLHFAFVINGKEIFCRGSNWVPAECMTGTLQDERYYALIKAARDANFNMLRVWGGGIYEKDCFYEYCDKMGIMVWQEFMFACSEIPEDDLAFIQEITKEATWQVKRLRNHPCLTYWCGENEVRGAFSDAVEERYSVFTLHYLLRGITAELCPHVPYERTSPYSYSDMENDVYEGDCHHNLSEICLFHETFKGFDEATYEAKDTLTAMYERIKNYERYVEGTKSNFSSECAVLGMCNYESLIKFTPENALTLDSKFLENRFLGNPYTYVMPTFFERQQRLAEGMYGQLRDIKDLVKKSNKSQSDIIKTEILHCRTNGRSTGVLNWMYNDIWPTGTWSVIDYYLSKKPAYYQMKRCFQPLLCDVVRLGDSYYFCIVNDEATQIEAEYKIGAYTYAGEELQSVVHKTSVTKLHREEISMDVENADYLCVTGTVGGKAFSATYELSRYRDKTFTPVYTVEKTDLDEYRAEITVRAKTFVPCFKIYAGEDAEIEDNFFDMAAGENKTVMVTTKGKAQYKYQSFADEWSE